MKNRYSYLWRWSWLLTLPVVCLFIYWGWVTAERFYTFGVRYNCAPIPCELHDSGVKEFNVLCNRAKSAAFASWRKQIREQGPLRSINLFVPEPSLAELNSNLPHSGFQYVEGRILSGDKLRKMKLKYRGDFVYHWGERKKSLRVKTRKKTLFEGLRAFNLIGTKQLETHFACRLAKEMGLIAPRTELVEVILNGKLQGAYVYVEQLEELTLRSNGCMPGDLYAGELLAKDAYRGIHPDLFRYPWLWEKVAVNNHYDEDSRKPLERLLALVNSPDSVRAHQELSQLLDIDAWGKFVAFETLCQTFHYDDVHNWRLYYDPMKSRFYPVIWDPLGWLPWWMPQGKELAQLDIIPSKFHAFLFENADIVRARARAIEDFFAKGQDKNFLRELKKSLDGWNKAIKRDPFLIEPTETVLVAADSFGKSIGKVFSDVEKGYLGRPGEVKYQVKHEGDNSVQLSLSVDGRMPVTALRLSFSSQIDGPVVAGLSCRMNGEKIEADISGAVSLQGANLEITSNLVSYHQKTTRGDGVFILKQKRLEAEPGHYILTLTGIDDSTQLIDFSYRCGNGDYQSAEKTILTEKNDNFFDFYNIITPQPRIAPEIWSGVIDISGVRKLSRPLLIKPGAVVRFRPGASLILQNRLLAEGTAQNPIRFVGDGGPEPWGTVTLCGQGANGSRLKYCQFDGGSGLKGELFEYTAMFSIHDVEHVMVDSCSFRDSKITDDMVHAVYSDVHFTDCVFEHSLMDALDIDISDAVIEHCRFFGSGNDAIDLMTTKAVVLDTLIENSGDKAVSVGEGAKLVAINNVFRRNRIAVQAKDGSVAALYNTDFAGNEHTLDAYKKNWRYNDGGDIYVYKSYFAENLKMITADKKSRIRVFDSYMDRVVATDHQVKIDRTVDQSHPRQARIAQLQRHKKEEKTMSGIDSAYLTRIHCGQRGATNLVFP
ncbi:CotH kinase family protein [uncultured Desulfuromonas sp.]|uniref:CotH kinase family protein n=1 Tax=uncultured Desulfuromonas sp. TaxID=181013 RepID=UPI002AAB551C|nr:CotH kinase family protein [uncultured Desulfuromonas sp.]